MNTYFFVLGTNHSLSKVDIVNTLAREGIDFEIEAASEELLVINVEGSLKLAQEGVAEALIGKLGSAAKIGETFRAYPKNQFPESFLKDVAGGEFKAFFLPQSELGKFGLSVYGAGGKFRDLNEIFFLVPKLEREIKAALESQGASLNYIKRKGRELSTVAVDKEGLLTKGFELVLGVGKNEVFVGKTLAIQDYEGYSLRDYGRPARDPKSGMLPPKLAKMMINLALADKDELMLDPFCGSGTMLQEMALLGYGNLIGSDSSEKSIRDTKENLNWLFEQFKLPRQKYKINLFQSDVAKIASQINYKTVGAIVTEPYLGSPRAKSFHLGQIEKEVSKLGKLYLAAFGEFRKVLRDKGSIVMIFPVFRFKGKLYQLDIMDGIYALGFKKRDYLPTLPKGAEKLNLSKTSRDSIVFFRPGQTVSREIIVFERV